MFTRIVMALIGAGVLAYATFQISANLNGINHSVIADGMVQDGIGHPVIEFSNDNGSTIRFKQNGFFSAPAGSPVRVRYEPGDAEATARVDRFWPLWGAVLWPVPIGLALVILAALNALPELRPGRY